MTKTQKNPLDKSPAKSAVQRYRKTWLTAETHMGYKDRNSFLVAAQKNGVFHIRINSRKFCWSENAIKAWKQEKGIGNFKPIYT